MHFLTFLWRKSFWGILFASEDPHKPRIRDPFLSGFLKAEKIFPSNVPAVAFNVRLFMSAGWRKAERANTNFSFSFPASLMEVPKSNAFLANPFGK